MRVDEASHHRCGSDAGAVLTGVPGCNLSMPATMILSAGATPLMIRTRLTRGVPSVTGCTVALSWASTFPTYGPSAPRVMARAGTNTPLGEGIPEMGRASSEDRVWRDV